jgi:hypothetical protein
VNSSALPVSVETPNETAAELIARVLRQAHEMVENMSAPDEARTVLHIAHSFADELAARDPGFDRLEFIKQVTEDPS